MKNFAALRNGILDHRRAGKMPPFDSGIFDHLIMRADWETGIYHGCALTLAFDFGDVSLKEPIQRCLRRLRDRRYINYARGTGARGGYAILIHKYEMTKGKLTGMRLNAWMHNGLPIAEYEPQNGEHTVDTRSAHGEHTVSTPIQDLKTLDIKTGDEDPLKATHAITLPDFLRIWNENCADLPKLREMTKSRTDKLRARCQRKPTFEHDFVEAVKKAAQTPSLLGENDRGWKANFDWLISNDRNHLAILEGKYDGVRKESSDKRGAFVNAGDINRYERGADFTMRVG